MTAPATAIADEASAWDRSLPAGAHLLQSYRWGELQSRFGWDVERREIDVGGETVPVSMLVAATATPGARQGYIPKGPAVPRTALHEAMSAIARLARDQGLAYVRVEPDIEAPFDPPADWRRTAATQPEHTSIIDLKPDEDELMAGLKPKTRYNIRLAMKRGVLVARSDDIGAFAQMARETSARHRIQLADEPYYRAVLEILGPADQARLYLAHHDQQPLAGIIVTRFGGHATYLFGASARTGRQLMPAYLLHWHAIQDLKAVGDVDYDLWGIPPDDRPSHPLAGLWQFKSGWNGRHVGFAGAYAHVANVTIWRADQAMARIRGNVRRVRSRLRRQQG